MATEHQDNGRADREARQMAEYRAATIREAEREEHREAAALCRRQADMTERGIPISAGYPGVPQGSALADVLRREAEAHDSIADPPPPRTAAEKASLDAAYRADCAHEDRRRTALAALAVAGVPVTARVRGRDVAGVTTGRVRGELVEVRTGEGRTEWAGWGFVRF